MQRELAGMIALASMRPAHSAREISAAELHARAGGNRFNEARAFSAGNHRQSVGISDIEWGFNEARAFSAGNPAPVARKCALLIDASMRPAHSAREIHDSV